MSIFHCCQADKTALHLGLSTASTSALSQERAASCEFYYCLTPPIPFASWFHSFVCFLRLSSFVLKTVKQDFWRMLQIHNDRVVFCISTAVTNTYYSTPTSMFPAKCKHLFKKVPRFTVQLTLNCIKNTVRIATVLFFYFLKLKYCINNLLSLLLIIFYTF